MNPHPSNLLWAEPGIPRDARPAAPATLRSGGGHRITSGRRIPARGDSAAWVGPAVDRLQHGTGQAHSQEGPAPTWQPVDLAAWRSISHVDPAGLLPEDRVRGHPPIRIRVHAHRCPEPRPPSIPPDITIQTRYGDPVADQQAVLPCGRFGGGRFNLLLKPLLNPSDGRQAASPSVHPAGHHHTDSLR
jgi:hypothetical protein